ncbi:MAG TPA: redoxin domain-containing protein [Myxococcales bacterium]|nr:redoxin domain-containing protein [Myxococcales bacterium]
MAYAAQGFTALVVHVGDQLLYAQNICRDANLSLPMVMDVDSSVLDLYGRVGEDVKLFPLGYLIDKQGVVQEVYTDEEPDIPTLKIKIEELLAQ